LTAEKVKDDLAEYIAAKILGKLRAGGYAHRLPNDTESYHMSPKAE
jgi:hypothetical protein